MAHRSVINAGYVQKGADVEQSRAAFEPPIRVGPVDQSPEPGVEFVMIQSSPLARKLGAFVALSAQELAVLDGLHQRRRTFVAGRDLIYEGPADQRA